MRNYEIGGKFLFIGQAELCDKNCLRDLNLELEETNNIKIMKWA